MGELEVRIVTLEPMRVASAHAFGPSPEDAAFAKLIAWAKPKGLTADRQAHRVFGFNNPSPSPGSPNYGYEFWIVVGPEAEPEGEIKVKEFGGGRYAVARCKGVEGIGPTWKKLNAWLEDSKHEFSHHQWLEENVGDLEAPPEELLLDLYLPIAT